MVLIYKAITQFYNNFLYCIRKARFFLPVRINHYMRSFYPKSKKSDSCIQQINFFATSQHDDIVFSGRF